MLIDTHCHLFHEYYDDLDEIVNKIKLSDIDKVINNGTNNIDNVEVLDSIQKYDIMYGAIGMHPEFANEYAEEDLKFIEKNVTHKKIVAIGEIGLDYHYDRYDKEKQMLLFKSQLDIASKYNLPVIIHSRDAGMDTLLVLKKYKLKGVIHCFSGSLEMAKEYIKLGYHLGINGVVTFPNCNLINIIKEIGLEHFVLETDCPYLTPVPFRGEKNDSSKINYIVEFLSKNLNIDVEEIKKITCKNAFQVFDKLSF